MSQLRRDGTWTIYQIETESRKYDNDPDNQYAGWHEIGSVFYYTKKYPWSSTFEKDRPKCVRLLGASGQCWQQTGNDGYLDEATANELLLFLQEYGDLENYRFRVVKKTISQSTEVRLQLT